MNFDKASPQDESYWWVQDDDGEKTVAYVEHLANGKVVASFTGNEQFYDAKDLLFLAPVGEQIDAKTTETLEDVHFNNKSVEIDSDQTTPVLNTIVSGELDQEKIRFANHLIALFPNTMTQTEILRMLENVLKATESKEYKWFKQQGIISKDAQVCGSLPNFGVTDKKHKNKKQLSLAEQELHDMDAGTKR